MKRIFLLLCYLICETMVVTANDGGGKFVITQVAYDMNSNWDEIITRTFGEDYRVAEWDNSLNYDNNGDNFQKKRSSFNVPKENNDSIIFKEENKFSNNRPDFITPEFITSTFFSHIDLTTKKGCGYIKDCGDFKVYELFRNLDISDNVYNINLKKAVTDAITDAFLTLATPLPSMGSAISNSLVAYRGSGTLACSSLKVLNVDECVYPFVLVQTRLKGKDRIFPNLIELTISATTRKLTYKYAKCDFLPDSVPRLWKGQGLKTSTPLHPSLNLRAGANDLVDINFSCNSLYLFIPKWTGHISYQTDACMVGDSIVDGGYSIYDIESGSFVQSNSKRHSSVYLIQDSSINGFSLHKPARYYISDLVSYATKGTFYNEYMCYCNDITMIEKNSPLQSTIGFILDSSGSMSGNDPNDIRISGVQQIADLVNPDQDKFLLCEFDEEARWLNSDNYANWNRTELKDQITTIDSSGGTDIDRGLGCMEEAFKKSGGKSQFNAVMLLSDGESNISESSLDWYVQNRIPVYTIGLSDDADANLLEQIAIKTGGVFTLANSDQDVVEAFLQFYNRLKNNSVFVSDRDTLKANEWKAHGFYVDKATKEMIVQIRYDCEDPELKIEDPSGKQILAMQGVDFIEGQNYKMYRIETPQYGNWVAKVGGVNAVVDVKYLLEAAGNAPDEVLMNGTLTSAGNIQISFDKKGAVFTQEDIKVSITTPKSSNINKCQSGAINFDYYPLDGKGTYKFKVIYSATNANGERISRNFTQSILVGKDLPGYISPITEVMGRYVYTRQSRQIGNKAGFKCKIYAADNSQLPIAIGTVISVNESLCTVEVVERLENVNIKPGCLVEIDVKEWLQNN